jgi:polyferredoxin
MVHLRVRKKSFGHLLLRVEVFFGIPMILFDLIMAPLNDWPHLLLFVVPVTAGSLFIFATIFYAGLTYIANVQERGRHQE